MGGAALHLGNIAEMKTGEGKTLTSVFPAYLNAISGEGVHLVTTNDYLANGGDGFSTLTLGSGRVTAPGFDVDALVAYLATGPIPPGPADRLSTTA